MSSFSLFWTKSGIALWCSETLTGPQASHLTSLISVFGIVFKIILFLLGHRPTLTRACLKWSSEQQLLHALHVAVGIHLQTSKCVVLRTGEAAWRSHSLMLLDSTSLILLNSDPRNYVTSVPVGSSGHPWCTHNEWHKSPWASWNGLCICTSGCYLATPGGRWKSIVYCSIYSQVSIILLSVIRVREKTIFIDHLCTSWDRF